MPGDTRHKQEMGQVRNENGRTYNNGTTTTRSTNKTKRKNEHQRKNKKKIKPVQKQSQTGKFPTVCGKKKRTNAHGHHTSGVHNRRPKNNRQPKAHQKTIY